MTQLQIKIADAEALSRAHTSFRIPSSTVRRSLGVGDLAKVVITSAPLPPRGPDGERPWLTIVGARGGRYVARLESSLMAWPWRDVHKPGDLLTFGPEHVIDVAVRSESPAVLAPAKRKKRAKKTTSTPKKRAPKKRAAKKRTPKKRTPKKRAAKRAPVKLARRKKAIRPRKKRATKRRKNVEQTSKRVASRAAKLLRKGSRAVRSVAGSALTQAPDRKKKRTKKRKTASRKR
jgi:hypothetical protein